MDLQAGTRINQYEIKQRLGAGGMADVFLATDSTLGRDVALKVLPPEFARDPERVSRFDKEVRACAALSHPNIVQVYDVGEYQRYDITLKYYAMALLPGGDLKDKIRAGLSEADSLKILKNIADALAHAHEAGFVHRDIKPENVLFDRSGNAVLTDLGIAKAMGSGTKMTKTGMSIGTPHYMSPEQARGEALDGRSDLYSVGVLFYEMLTGAVPYDKDDTFAVALSHINDPVPELPASLHKYQPMVSRLLAKAPVDRYQGGDALVGEIEKLQAGEMLNAFQPTRQVAAVGRSANSSSDNDAGSSKKGHGLVWGLGGASLAAVLGVVMIQSGILNTSPAQRPAGAGAAAVNSAPVSTAQPVTPAVTEAELARQRLQDIATQQEVERLLRAAREDIGASRLTSPQDNNAFDKVQQVLALVPNHSGAQEVLVAIVDRYQSLAENALNASNFEQARNFINTANALLPDYPGYERMKARIDTAASRAELVRLTGTLVNIPAGSFQMGSTDGDDDEKPVRRVSVPAFRLGAREVTVGQFRAFVQETDYQTDAERNFANAQGCYVRDSDSGQWDWATGRSWRSPGFEQTDNHPVVCVSYNDVNRYLTWLNGKSEQKFRLPSEAEWEYAARAGSTTRYHFGDDSSQLCRYGNVADNTPLEGSRRWTNRADCDDGFGARTAPVGNYQANAFGLYDMHGNVREWVQDCWNGSYNGAPTNGSAWMQGDCSRAVLRGGSWLTSPDWVRSAYRNRYGRATRSYNSGFRLAQDI